MKTVKIRFTVQRCFRNNKTRERCYRVLGFLPKETWPLDTDLTKLAFEIDIPLGEVSPKGGPSGEQAAVKASGPTQDTPVVAGARKRQR